MTTNRKKILAEVTKLLDVADNVESILLGLEDLQKLENPYPEEKELIKSLDKEFKKEFPKLQKLCKRFINVS